jgi:hypothetical protein
VTGTRVAVPEISFRFRFVFQWVTHSSCDVLLEMFQTVMRFDFDLASHLVPRIPLELALYFAAFRCISSINPRTKQGRVTFSEYFTVPSLKCINPRRLECRARPRLSLQAVRGGIGKFPDCDCCNCLRERGWEGRPRSHFRKPVVSVCHVTPRCEHALFYTSAFSTSS